MKKIFTLLFLICLFSFGQEIKTGIVVTAEAIQESEPDLAVIQIGVSLQDRTADKVYQQVNNTINQILKSLKDIGIKKEDIKTEGIGLYPQYDYAGGKQKFIGFQMYHNLTVRVKDINKVANVIDNATLSGANTISNISFGFQEPEKLASLARAKAIEAADKKAKEIAKTANLMLGKIIQITESSYPYEVFNMMRGSGGGAEGLTAVAPGLSSVKVIVTVTYSIKESGK